VRQSAQLIEQIIGLGRSSGLGAGDIAVRAGIAPNNLSRIRKSGRFNADTLERLLNAVDGTLTVAPASARRKSVVSAVAQKLNAGRREQISSDELRRLLTRFRRGALAERAYSHLVGVIEELPVEQAHDLILEGGATLPALKRVADYVDGQGPTADWINEQTSP